MKKFIFILFIFIFIDLNGQYLEPHIFRSAVGIDIGRTLKNKIAHKYNSPEFFYRHYLHRRWYLLEAIGFNTHKSTNSNNEYKKIFGVYNRIGVHYVTHKWFSLRHFCRIPKQENGSVGINFIFGYARHNGRVNFTGPLLTSPFVQNINQKITFRGFELEWNPIIIKEHRFQVNLNFKTGVLIPSKTIENEDFFYPFTSIGIGYSDGYGSVMGVNLFYKFGQ